MRPDSRVFPIGLLLMIALVAPGGGAGAPPATDWKPVIPKVWDDDSVRTVELELAEPGASPRHVTADYYYRMPVRPIYRSYPVYRPGREPKGYRDSLLAREPEIVFDAATLRTHDDWVRAGSLVFDAPIEFIDSGTLYEAVQGAAWYDENHVPTTRDGILPFMSWVVREKGKVELGILACAMCHTRVMPDGTTIRGAQGNFPDDRTFGWETRREAAQSTDPAGTLREFREYLRKEYAAPWLKDDPLRQIDRMTIDELATLLEAIPPGVCARQGTSPFYPPRIPDLIGIRDRRYLDSTGLVHHRSATDLMRYAVINQGADALALYGDFRPAGELPDPAAGSRYSDEQLVALGAYVYSLVPPPNPNRYDDLAARGEAIFQEQGCAGCHTPPIYTNNRLNPTENFEIPAEHLDSQNPMRVSVGTDPNLAMRSRRGTGYYKVPSLRGLWYRGPIEHNGSVATLEEWFDPARTREDYRSGGFHRFGIARQAVPGHPFGLDLSPDDRRALIAFLRTL